ncbi:acyl-CoA dehydrogenase family protein [Enemella sp. A6]|uniref:acyl-CoA dehydrogenase family protein n=1 Tax=Enemella sp. A6 TaxID=3440152 RepID=UPI003EBB0679
MRFAVAAENDEFRALLADALPELCTPEVIRAIGDDPSGEAAESLRGSLAELGVTGLLVDEDHDGLGMDEDTLVVVLREMGRAGVPLPMVETLAWAPGLAGPAGFAAELAAGEILVGSDLADSGTNTALTANRVGVGGFAGRGPVRFITPDDAGERIATVNPAAQWGATPGGDEVTVDDEALVERAWLRGVIGAAAVLCGLSDRMLTMTVEYAKERQQFGKPIGSFQAIKHHLANALIALDFAWPTVLAGAHQLASGDTDAARTISMAKARASEAAQQIAKASIQSHGAIAYTTEYDLQLYVKQAWELSSRWGSPAWHRDRVGDAIGLPAGGPRPVA